MNTQKGFIGIAVLLIVLGLGAGVVYLQKTGTLSLFQSHEEVPLPVEYAQINEVSTQESSVPVVEPRASVSVSTSGSSEKVSQSCESLKNYSFISTKAFLRSEGDGMKKSSIRFTADGKFSQSFSDYVLGGVYSCANTTITLKGKFDSAEIRVTYNPTNKSFVYKGYEYVGQ